MAKRKPLDPYTLRYVAAELDARAATPTPAGDAEEQLFAAISALSDEARASLLSRFWSPAEIRAVEARADELHRALNGDAEVSQCPGCTSGRAERCELRDGHAEVSHEEARGIVGILVDQTTPLFQLDSARDGMLAYISQQEANSNALAQALGVAYRGESFSWLLDLVRRDARAAGSVLPDAATPAPADTQARNDDGTLTRLAQAIAWCEQSVISKEASDAPATYYAKHNEFFRNEVFPGRAKKLLVAAVNTGLRITAATPAPAGDAEVSHDQARLLLAAQRIAEYKASEADWRERLRAAQSALQGKDKAIVSLQAKLVDLAGDGASLGFGVDPEDSAALLRLRECIDDNLPWPDDATREAGNYEAAVRHSGELSQKLEAAEREFRDFVQEFARYLSNGERDNEAYALREKYAAHVQAKRQGPPDQPPPAKPLTPDDVRTIAREVIAEAARKACEACGKVSGHGFPLAKLAAAAKEETGG